MNAHLKKLEPSEILVYSCCIFPLKTVGPLKFWVETTDPQQDIREGKIVGIMTNAKVFKKVKIKIPTVGYKGRFFVTPELVLSQLDRSDFQQVTGYSVKIDKPVCNHDKALSTVDPSYYEATVTLFQSESRPKKLIFKKYDLPRRHNKDEKIKKNKEK